MLLLGLALYFAIIPTYVEEAQDGNIAPATLPNILSLVIAFCGAWLAARPTGFATDQKANIVTAGIFAVTIGLGLFAISWFGFLLTAPFLALAIMLLQGERRPIWLVLGTVVTPALIWILVVQILDRALP